MTAKVVAIYKMPTDPAAFDRYYFGTHVPLAKKIPGLRRYEVSRGPVAAIAGPSPGYLIATLTFDSAQAIQSALASPEGRATAADIGNFATGGAEICFFASEDV
jgi:uncharacterized protein (TIGR02118 family)